MLVLSRKLDESIIIGDDVVITVVDVKGEQVKIGITAPRSVSIHRKEVYEAIQEENRAAARPQPHDLRQLKDILPSLPQGLPQKSPPTGVAFPQTGSIPKNQRQSKSEKAGS